MVRVLRKLKKIHLYTCLIIISLYIIYVLNMRTWKYYVHRLRKHQGNKLKYVLHWTSAQAEEPLRSMGVGQQGFIDRKCPHSNCFVTSDRDFLGYYTEFDVILFTGRQLKHYQSSQLPKKRSPHQKYAFFSAEPAAYFPTIRKCFDGFFNWTWTYKLNSDLIWGYISITDLQGNVIGPKDIMHWMKHEEMLPASDELRYRLRRKKKAVAWLVSHCKTMNQREQLANALNKVLHRKYNLSVDIYGKCGNLYCDDCDEMIKQDYFFYLAFENSISEDYVTEKISHAVENYAIPIVYGGANYSRFLPNGSYLDVMDYNIRTLARKMYELIDDFEAYVDYFRWTNHYRYHRKTNTNLTSNNYCEMCALLNNETVVESVSVYREFSVWWNEWEYPSVELLRLANIRVGFSAAKA